MGDKQIKSALISVYHKEGLGPIVKGLDALGVTIYSTGGTQAYIKSLGVAVVPVEGLTSYPSILDGRVKTLHPKVFGGILATKQTEHLAQLDQYAIPAIDLVIVDLYPFEQTVRETEDESAIIEKIDIGGIALIRAAAKNFREVLVIPSREDYPAVLQFVEEKGGTTSLNDRKKMARRAFYVSSHYDTAIFDYFAEKGGHPSEKFEPPAGAGRALRYGENPHQNGFFFGDLEKNLRQIHGKALSYNNLVDIDAGIALMREFKSDEPTFAILKHTNSCGLATRSSIFDAWEAALAGDNISAFGGILVSNRKIDVATASAINRIFYEVLIAPDYEENALAALKKKKTRVLLQIEDFKVSPLSFKSLLNGVIQQETDLSVAPINTWKTATQRPPSASESEDLFFADRCVKHLKSNAIALVKDKQLIGMGCGQTSRVDALEQSVKKAEKFGFDLVGAVMASDAFFPFPDCVEIADQAGITAVIQPGGSIRDQDSINYCNDRGMAMVLTGMRHFKH